MASPGGLSRVWRRPCRRWRGSRRSAAPAAARSLRNASRPPAWPRTTSSSTGSASPRVPVVRRHDPAAFLWWGVRVTLPCKAPLHKEPHRENAKELHVYPPNQGAWQRPEDHGAGPPPDASPPPPVPDTFDEIVPDSPLTAEADFAPLQELGPAERADLTAVDPYQADSLHAQAAFERAVAAA